MPPSRTPSLRGESNVASDEPMAEEATPLSPGEVTLTIPAAPEYVGTARLTILGVAGRMGFSYDQIEDIRLAVGEACTNAIERTIRSHGGDAGLTIRCEVEASRLTVEVEDQARVAAETANTEAPAFDVGGMNNQELGALLMEILVDEVTVESLPGGGTRVRLVKYAAEV